MATLGGLKIATSVWLTEPGEPVQVARPWKERWLSRPWRPWQRTKTHVPQVPMKTAYRVGDTLFMHPAMKDELLRLRGLAKVSQAGPYGMLTNGN